MPFLNDEARSQFSRPFYTELGSINMPNLTGDLHFRFSKQMFEFLISGKEVIIEPMGGGTKFHFLLDMPSEEMFKTVLDRLYEEYKEYKAMQERK